MIYMIDRQATNTTLYSINNKYISDNPVVGCMIATQLATTWSITSLLIFVKRSALFQLTRRLVVQLPSAHVP